MAMGGGAWWRWFGGLLPLDGLLAVVAVWLVLAVAGLIRLHDLRFIAKVLFPVGAASAVAWFQVPATMPAFPAFETALSVAVSVAATIRFAPFAVALLRYANVEPVSVAVLIDAPMQAPAS